MDARNEAAAATASNTTTFDPYSDLIQEDDCNTLLLYLPGFTKEQLKVQLTRTRVLKVSGTRPLTNDKWSSFQKDFPVAENCDTNKITAKFEDGILYVRQPKDEKTAVETAPAPQKPAEERRPGATKLDSPPTPMKKTAQTTGDIKQAAPPKDSPPKPVQSREEIKSAETSSASESGEKEEKRKHAAEKSGGDDKGAAVARKEAEKRGKGSGEKVEADYNKLNAASPAARLKDARNKMTNILVLLCVFALGVYASKLPWFSKRAGD